jgi:hypothetical protein
MGESGHCELCSLPLVEVDAYGQRLRGCMGCNNWQEVSSGEWLRLSEDDIVAIRGWNSSRAIREKKSPDEGD